jgi:hypothetical protein
MKNLEFGDIVFNTGWKTKTDITLWGTNYNIIIKAKAYFEKDGITSEQEIAFGNFKKGKTEYLKNAEDLLNNFSSNAADRFTPKTLLFERDGGYALLLDDKEDEDGGIAVCFAPKMEILSQDEYL